MGNTGKNDDGFDATLQDLASEVRAMRAELDELRSENRALRDRLDPPTPERRPEPRRMVRKTDEAGGIGRRRLLRDGLIAGAAATTAVVASGTPAAAANGDPILLGQVNTATNETVITGSVSGFRVELTPPLLQRYVGGAIVGYGDLVVGVNGHAENTFGVSATGKHGVRVNTKGAHLWLTSSESSTRQSPLFDPVGHARGEIIQSSDGDLWHCVAGGVPGEWRKLSGVNAAGSFHLLPTPVRVYDSRPGTTPSQGPKTPLPAGNVARTIDMSANNSGVPKTVTPSGGRYAATGVLLNVLLVNAASGGGNVTVWANDQPKPQSNTLVWGGTAGRFSTLAVSGVDTLARVKVDASLQTNVVIDVVGYYR